MTQTLKSCIPFCLSELKVALKNLGAKHPAAYDEFVRTLHPGAGNVTVLQNAKVYNILQDPILTLSKSDYLKMVVELCR